LKRALEEAANDLERRAEMARGLAESLSPPTTESLAAAAELAAGLAAAAATSRALAPAAADLNGMAAARVGEGGSARSGERGTRPGGITLIGPHFPTGAMTQSLELAGSPIGGPAATGANAGPTVSNETIETITPLDDPQSRSAVADDGGVPPLYRDRAARYLRRIAEESR
jgi:hypothetical protein